MANELFLRLSTLWQSGMTVHMDAPGLSSKTALVHAFLIELEPLLDADEQLWPGVDLHFPDHPVQTPDQLERHLVEHTLHHRRVDLLQSSGSVITAAFRFQYSPGAYFDYRADLGILARMGAAAGLPILLERDLSSGQWLADQPYFLAENLTLVYVTLGPETAFGSNIRMLEKYWSGLTPYRDNLPFIHLAATTSDSGLKMRASILTAQP